MNAQQLSASTRAPSSGAPRRAARARRRPWTSGLLALAALLAASGAARARQDASFDAQGDAFRVQVADAASFLPESCFGAAAHGRWNGDALLDAAVLVGEQPYALVNPGRWSAVVALGSAPVRDLAAMRRATPSADGLLAAGPGGVVLWTFDEGPANAFVATAIAGPWQAPRRVEVAALAEEYGLALLVVHDGPTNALHPCILAEGVAPGADPVLARLAPFELPRAPRALALYDPEGTGVPVIAVADDVGLRTYDLAGTLLDALPAASDVGLLHAFDPGAGGTARRLGWIGWGEGDPSRRLRVVDAAGVEGPVDLGALGATGLAFGDFDRLVGQDLLLGLETGGEARLLVNDCPVGLPLDPGEGAPPAATFRPGGPCEHELGAAGAATWASRAQPLFADFDLDRSDDVLLFDDGDGGAHYFARSPQPAVPSAVAPVDLFVHGLASTQGTLADPFLHLALDQGALATRGASHAEVIAWPWWDLAPPLELDGGIVGYQRRARDADGGWLEFHVELDLGEERPLLLGLEVRALREGDLAVLDAVTYAVTEDCDTYFALIALAPCSDCTAPSSCYQAVESPDDRGDYLGGLVPVPRLPPFGGDEQVPRIPPLPQ